MTVTEKQVMQALKGLGLTEHQWEVLTREGAPDDSINPRPFLMEFAQRIAALAHSWRTIDTAPEDEHILIATTGGHVGTAYWTDVGDGKVWAWGHPQKDGGQYVHPQLDPIGWMPLPEPPTLAPPTKAHSRNGSPARQGAEPDGQDLNPDLSASASPATKEQQ